MSNVLIIAPRTDVHANTVASRLQARGSEVRVVDASQFPAEVGFASECAPTGDAMVQDGVVTPSEWADTVWLRRPAAPRPDLERIHPEDRAQLVSHMNVFQDWFLARFAPRATWVNPYGAHLRGSNKLVQLEAARARGLKVPRTLATNDPERVVAFLREVGDAVYKPVVKHRWSDEGSTLQSYVVPVTEGQLPSAPVLRLQPAFYQERVRARFELRVNVLGPRCVTARIRLPEALEGTVDYHRVDMVKLAVEPFTLPAEVERACVALVADLGLRFACVDLCVDPDGRYVFFELNQMGQFLWLDTLSPGVGITEAFCDFLTAPSGRV